MRVTIWKINGYYVDCNKLLGKIQGCGNTKAALAGFSFGTGHAIMKDDLRETPQERRIAMPAELQERFPLTANRRALGQRVYCAAIVLLLILSEVFSSNIQSTLPDFSHLARLGLTGLGALLLAAKCLLLTRYEFRWQWAVGCAAVVYAAFAALHGDDIWFLLAVLIGLGAKDVDLRTALRVYLVTAAVCLVLVQLLHYTTPLMPFNVYARNWDYGYGHYNGYGARLLGVFFAWGWLRWPRLRWFDWAGLTALAAYTLLVPRCRGAGMAMCLLLVLFVAQRFLPRFFESRLWHGLVLALYPLLTLFSLISGYLFDPSRPHTIPGFYRLNLALSGRLEVWHHVFWAFDYVHPGEDGAADWLHADMPNVITFMGGFPTDADVHHSIDNTYLALVMNKGILGAVLVAAVTLFLLWRLCRAGHTGESMLLFAMQCYLLMENKMFLFSANPLILLLPCALLTPWGAPLPTLCPKPDVRTKDPATV